jgi:hypothetical protein
MIKSRRMSWTGHVARMRKKRNVYRILVRNPEWKKPFRRPKRRCEDYIKIYLVNGGWNGVDWVDLAQDKDDKPLGRPRRTWVNNIKIDLREIGWDDMNWIDLAQDTDKWRALVKAVMNLRVP